jgi:hypothetical protein
MNPEKQVCYVLVSDIDRNFFTFKESKKALVKDLPARVILPIDEGQVLLLSHGSNLGTDSQPLVYVDEEFDGCLASNSFIAIDFRETPLYYLIAMKHPLVLEQLRGMVSGSQIVSVINKESIRNLLIPKLGSIWRNDFNEKIKDALRMRKQGLELRKAAIEKVDNYIKSLMR